MERQREREKGFCVIEVNIKYYFTFQSICSSTLVIAIFTYRTYAAFILLSCCLFKNESGKKVCSPTATSKEVKVESDKTDCDIIC